MKAADTPFTYGGCVDAIIESDPEVDNFPDNETSGIQERRRKLHTEAEQRRRNAIKRGFESLLELIHPVRGSTPSLRMSKSTILQKTISMVEKLTKQRQLKMNELEYLRRKVESLRIMNSTYDKYFQNEFTPIQKSQEPVSEELKILVFQLFMESLFNTFEPHMTVAPFNELSQSAVIWLEESCQPEILAHIMNSVIIEAFSKLSDPKSAPQNATSDEAKHVGLSDYSHASSQHSVTWMNPSDRETQLDANQSSKSQLDASGSTLAEGCLPHLPGTGLPLADFPTVPGVSLFPSRSTPIVTHFAPKSSGARRASDFSASASTPATCAMIRETASDSKECLSRRDPGVQFERN